MKRWIVLYLLILFPISLFAGITGSLEGYVKDKETGEPLIGVNVFILKTKQGAATDKNGLALLTVDKDMESGTKIS